MSALDALMRGVHEALTGDGSVAALVSDRVFDRVPDRAVDPYLTYGATRTVPLDAEKLEAHELTVHAWSRGRGRSELRALLDAVAQALRGTSVSVRGHALVSMHVTGIQQFDEDGDVEHGIVALRAVTEPDTA